MGKIGKTDRKGFSLTLLFFLGALLLIGVMLRGRMESLLTEHTENQTKRQAESYALLAAQTLQTGLDDLSYVSSRLENNPDDLKVLMPQMLSESGVRHGLLTLDGRALYGKGLPLRLFGGVQSAFRGRSAITYDERDGLLFTCPVFNGVNVKYVLYCLYPTDTLEEHFSIRCYEDLGKICVVTRDEEIVIPFDKITNEDLEWFKSKEIVADYASMHRDMEVSVAAAKTFSTKKGDQILFEAEMPDSDFLVVGFVPKEVAAESVGNISLLVVWVFGMLMLLVMIGALYLVNASIKLKESNELRTAKAMAEEASRAKSDFLANMSHEIRTPINTVLGMNEMILRESDDRAILTYAGNIKNAGSTLLGLINDILDFSKIEAGKIEIIPVEYDLSSMLNDLVNMVHARADEKDLLLHLDFDSGLPRRLFGDEVRIKQVITNILTNAVKYTERGSITFSVQFETVLSAPDSVLLQVSVEDTGIGIRTEDMDKLFSEFERIDEKRNRNTEGTGLGMSITQNLLQMMGSTLHVYSTYGTGSTFSFAIRQRVIDWEVMGDYRASYRKHVKQTKGYREKFTAPEAAVLVVDDNPMNLMVFESLVKKTQVKVDKANSGDESILLSQDKKYDIIFMDHMMPHKDGIETLQEIRAGSDNPNVKTPAVCLTANAVSGAREKYIEAGFDDYLTKPIDPAKLEEMLICYLPEEKVNRTAPSPEDGQQGASGAGGRGGAAGSGTSTGGRTGVGTASGGLSGSAASQNTSANEHVAFEMFPEEETEQYDTLEPEEIPEAYRRLKDVGIDVETGIEHSETLDAYRSILGVFYDTMDEREAELREYYETGDFENYTIKVHALKSSARIVGAEEFGERAQRLEDAGKNGDLDYVRAHHAGFLEEYRAFREPLSGIFAASEAEGPANAAPEADAMIMEIFYEELREGSEAMDSDRIDGAFSEMEGYRIPAGEEVLFKKIKNAYKEFDYDRILELLNNH